MRNYKKQLSLFLYVSLFIVISSFIALFINFQRQATLQNGGLKIGLIIVVLGIISLMLFAARTLKQAQQKMITGHKKTEASLLSSEERYRQVVEAVQEGIWILDKNDDTLFINQRMCEMIEYSSEEIRGQKIFHFMDEESKKKELLQINRRKQGLMERQDAAFITRSGKLVGVKISMNPVLDESGNYNGALAMITDITERKLLEESLEKEKYFLGVLMDNIPDSIYFKDRASKLLRVSKSMADRFGISMDSFIGMSDFDFQNKIHANEAFEDEQNIQKTGKPRIDYIEKEISEDGSESWVSTTKMPLINARGEAVGTFGISRDITNRKLAEMALNNSEERYRQIVETAQEGIWMLDENNYTIFVNKKMCEMLEYSREEMMGKQNYYFKDEEGKKKAMQDIKRRKEGITETQTSKFITKSGKVVWTSLSTNPIFNDEGKYVGALGMFTDITARKNANEELIVAQQKFQAIFDNTADGIYQSTPDGKFIMVNPSMAKIFGYDSPDDLIRSVTHIGTQIYADPAERNEMSASLLQKGRINDFKFRGLTKKGNIIWVSENIHVVPGKNGDPVYFEGTLEDITERKKSEEQLLNLSNRLQLAIRATNIGIWDWDIVNNSIVWDEKMYHIYDVSVNDTKSIFESFQAAIHSEDLDRVNEEIQMALRGEKEYSIEFRVIWKDSSIHYIQTNALVQRDGAGNPLRMIGTNGDITDRKKAEEEILQLNRSLDQFANITAHDLQEPIRMVSGFLGLLYKKYNAEIDEQGKSYIHRAKDGADRMSILITDLLEFSRSGNKAARKEPVDLTVVLDLVDRDLSIVMADTGTIFRIPAFLPVVTGTQSALYRLFLNLISNGIKFRKKDVAPQITLTVNDVPDFWEFTLQDNGIGIADKDQPKLFQAFQRLHRREEYPGTGLGLVTCKKIVEIHGGKIWITSEQGKGTAFHFTIKKCTDS